MHHECRNHLLHFKSDSKVFDLAIVDDPGCETQQAEAPTIAAGIVLFSPAKVAAFIRSQLQLNRRIFARNCEIRRIDKKTAEDFFNTYHFMNATSSAYRYGLFYKNELVMAAAFSKGRKMNRLPDNQRSFELIRVSTSAGLTVPGGLSKLLKYFISIKRPGDIMTYVDSQLSKGEAFVKLGFKLSGKSAPLKFVVNRKTLQRFPYDEKLIESDPDKFRVTMNAGNLKLLLVPDYK